MISELKQQINNDFSLFNEISNGDDYLSLLEDSQIKASDHTVLIVDSSEETREVLSTVLERDGVKTVSTAIPRRGIELAQEVRPDLIVLDLETQLLSPQETIASFTENEEIADTPFVLLGTAKIDQTKMNDNFVSKPYHYAPLIQKIKEMLDLISNKQQKSQ